MKISGLTCSKCKDFIYSRARHDFRYCTCENCFVDGGFEYFKYGGNDFILGEIELNTTKQELFRDWNRSENKYGLIKG